MIYHSPDCLLHQPQYEFSGSSMRPYPEQAERVTNIIAALKTKDIIPQIPKQFSLDWISTIHDEDYVEFIQSIPHDLEEIAPTGFIFSGQLDPNSSFHAKLGKYLFDPATPIMGGTASAAFSAVNCVLSMVDDLHSTNIHLNAALCRPPGHHAMVNCGGGYCIFNNVAIAAQYLRSKGKSVSILDLDYHHGNGTQSIFYDRDDVQYISIHADTRSNYPFYWGFVEQTGEGDGKGYTKNIPVPNSISEQDYMDNLDLAIRVLKDYDPEITLVSMGFDGHKDDPIAGLSLTSDSYTMIGQKLHDLEKIGIVLEGGYALEAIGPSFLNLYSALSS